MLAARDALDLGTEIIGVVAERADAYARSFESGADADLVGIDPDLAKVVRGAEGGSRADFTPLEGRTLKGWPVTVVKGGEPVVEEGELVTDPGIGHCLNKIPR